MTNDNLVKLPQEGLFGARTGGLADSFVLPASVRDDDRYRGIYTDIVHDLRAEAAGIAMTTVQAMLVERIAATYVQLKYFEEEGLFEGRQEDELNKRFKEYAQEFNKVLMNNNEQQRAALMKSMQQATKTAIDSLPDEASKQHMRRAMASEFRKIEQ